MTEPNDNELMLLVKAGELDNMSLLFKRHYHSLYVFLFHMTHDKQVSEDMVQNVFYRMLKYRAGYKAASSFRTWMFHIARNLLKDKWMSSNGRSVLEDIDIVSDRISGGDQPDTLLEQKQTKAGLYLAMERLKKEDREIITLSKFQEFSYEEIGKLFQISEGAVKVRVHRAMYELKKIYQK